MSLKKGGQSLAIGLGEFAGVVLNDLFHFATHELAIRFDPKKQKESEILLSPSRKGLCINGLDLAVTEPRTSKFSIEVGNTQRITRGMTFTTMAQMARKIGAASPLWIGFFSWPGP